MLLFLFLFGLAVCAASPSDDSQVMLRRGNCPPFWFSFNGRCYKYIATQLSWAAAELHCVSERANLVSIHSLNEQNFIRSLIKNFDPAEGPTWNGLSDAHMEGRWMWSDGSAVDFVFWDAGQPNNHAEDCGVFDTASKWHDYPCSHTYPFVCASRTVCP